MVKVGIHCTVYNHAPYLRRCLDGIVSQQTNFPFVAIVHDDASTDESAEIIQEYAEKYPEIIKPIFEEENQYSKPGSIVSNIINSAIDDLGAKYTAICEGDDFWCDSTKLQTQVDILDNDESLMAVVTDAQIVDMHGNVLSAKRGHVVPGNLEGRYNLRDFFKEPTHKYLTASVVYRNTHREEIQEKMNLTSNEFLSDWTKWIILHIYGDFYYIDKPMVAYRINPTSVTHTENKVARAYAGVEICNAVADILPPEYADISQRLRRKKRELPISLAHAYLGGKQYGKVIWYTLISIFTCPGALLRTLKRECDRRNGSLSKYI